MQVSPRDKLLVVKFDKWDWDSGLARDVIAKLKTYKSKKGKRLAYYHPEDYTWTVFKTPSIKLDMDLFLQKARDTKQVKALEDEDFDIGEWWDKVEAKNA